VFGYANFVALAPDFVATCHEIPGAGGLTVRRICARISCAPNDIGTYLTAPSGEMETVFESFRNVGFFRASEAHGSAAIFGGITRTLEMDHAAMAASFRNVLEDIQSGGFARRFQEEERNGYPMLALAREMIRRECPISAAEDHVRRLSSGTSGRTDDKALSSHAGACDSRRGSAT
jgi:hypothetical protein